MYVCMCKAVTDTDIKQALDGGAQSLSDIQQTLQVGMGCGRCQEEARSVINGYRAEQADLYFDVGANTASAY